MWRMQNGEPMAACSTMHATLGTSKLILANDMKRDTDVSSVGKTAVVPTVPITCRKLRRDFIDARSSCSLPLILPQRLA
jgi:hypothetical protein